MDKQELATQTKLAFDFVQKLYFETSYLIKEIEGVLAEEEEHFIIGRPSGYGITTNRSSGLEPYNVDQWLMRKFSVFFIPEDGTKISRGHTITKFSSDTKIIYMKILLEDKEIDQPTIYAGVLFGFGKKDKKWPEKFEQVMAHIEYHGEKVLKNIESISYEDSYITLEGKAIKRNLYDVNTSEDITKMILEPTLKLYRDT